MGNMGSNIIQIALTQELLLINTLGSMVLDESMYD